MTQSLDSFKCKKTLTAGGKTYTYFSIPEAEKNGLEGVSRLPFSLKAFPQCSHSKSRRSSLSADVTRLRFSTAFRLPCFAIQLAGPNGISVAYRSTDRSVTPP